MNTHSATSEFKPKPKAAFSSFPQTLRSFSLRSLARTALPLALLALGGAGLQAATLVDLDFNNDGTLSAGDAISTSDLGNNGTDTLTAQTIQGSPELALAPDGTATAFTETAPNANDRGGFAYSGLSESTSGDFTMATSFRLNNLATVDSFDTVMDAGGVGKIHLLDVTATGQMEVLFDIGTVGGNRDVHHEAINEGEWMYLTLVYDFDGGASAGQASAKAYINGTVVGSDNNLGQAKWADGTRLGTLSSGDSFSSKSLEASAADVKVWDEALTDSQVLTEFQATGIPEPGAYAAILGGVGLGLCLLRRRRGRA